MSGYPNPESEPQTDSIDAIVTHLPLEETTAWRLAQQTPEQALEAEVSAKVLFIASQIGMRATDDWKVRAGWTSVYLKAIGPHNDY